MSLGAICVARKYDSLKVAAKEAGYRRLSETYATLEDDYIRSSKKYKDSPQKPL